MGTTIFDLPAGLWTLAGIVLVPLGVALALLNWWERDFAAPRREGREDGDY